MTEVNIVAAAVNATSLSDGSSLVERVCAEATPYILYAAPYIMKASGAHRRMLENLKKNCGAKLVVDSGGFELAEGTAHGIDPVEVVKLQNAVASFGFILDFPPDHKPFDECLKMTSEHVRAAASITKTFEYYLVAHGRDMSQIRTWVAELKDLDVYDGISVSGIEFSELLRGFIFAAECDTWDRWHFLGTSSIVQISLIQYLARVMKEKGHKVPVRMTFDSSTPTQFGKVCKMFHPLVPLEVLDPRAIGSEALARMGVYFDGTSSSCILANIRALANYNKTLSMIDTSSALAEFVEILLAKKLEWKWDLGRRVIDTAFAKGPQEAVKLIPPELDRVAGLAKKVSILNL